MIQTEHGPGFISELSREASSRGYDCILGKDPLMPEKGVLLVLSQLGIGFTVRPARKELRRVDRKIYGSALKQAQHELCCAKALHDELEAIYTTAVDFQSLSELTQKITTEITAEFKLKSITF